MRALIPLLAVLLSLPAAAQEIEVPVETQVPILLKVLGFDRNVAQAAGPLRIGILHQPRVRSSRAVFEAFVAAVRKSGIRSVADRPLLLVPVEIDSEADLPGQLVSAGVEAVYVAPLRAVRISAVTEVTREHHITTLTGVPDYVIDGLTVGLNIRGQKPEILVNLVSQRAERADFSAQLLKMVRIIQ